MRSIQNLVLLLFIGFLSYSYGQEDGYRSNSNPPVAPKGYQLKWADEFEISGKPDNKSWSYERGFQRNQELQWYQTENAIIKNGVLVIEGKRERIENPDYDPENKDWRKSRKFAEYTSSSINTNGKHSFKFGIIEVRAKINVAKGMWPAIWTLGISKKWPANGEVDIMEFYRVNNEPTILANAAWLGKDSYAEWDGSKTPFSRFLKKDPKWAKKFHIWKMVWSEAYIRLYLDGELLNEINLSKTLNPHGFNPFHQPHYLLLNLAIGGNGGDPDQTIFPKKYEVDYVRVYQKK